MRSILFDLALNIAGGMSFHGLITAFGRVRGAV